MDCELIAGEQHSCTLVYSRSCWQCGLRTRSEASRLLGSRVPNPLEDINFIFSWFASFQASAANWMRTVLFRTITQLLFVNSLPPFRDNLSSSKKGPIGCPKTSVINYHYTLRNCAEERSPLVWLVVKVAASATS